VTSLAAVPRPVHGGLSDVLPSVARALGVVVSAGGRATGEQALVLPEATTAVVVLVDGLGDRLLTRRGGHAPFLRHLRSLGAGPGGPGGARSDGAGGTGSSGGGTGSVRAWTLTAGFPSTTATSMGTFGTGELPGAHGMVGLDVLDPARDVLFNELAWDPEVDPRTWQPVPTVFEQVVRAGLDVVRIGPGYFDGSGADGSSPRRRWPTGSTPP
jgi:hypothetical protein